MAIGFIWQRFVCLPACLYHSPCFALLSVSLRVRLHFRSLAVITSFKIKAYIMCLCCYPFMLHSLCLHFIISFTCFHRCPLEWTLAGLDFMYWKKPMKTSREGEAPQNVARSVNFSKLPNGQLATLCPLSLSRSHSLLLCSAHKSLRDFATQACSILFSAWLGSFCFCGLRSPQRGN